MIVLCPLDVLTALSLTPSLRRGVSEAFHLRKALAAFSPTPREFVTWQPVPADFPADFFFESATLGHRGMLLP